MLYVTRHGPDLGCGARLYTEVSLQDYSSSNTVAATAGNGENEMVTPLKHGSIGQISRSVKNIKQAEAWYGEVLGLPHLYTFGTLAFFDCGGVRLFLSQVDSSSQ